MSRTPYHGYLNSDADTEFATESMPVHVPPDGRDAIIDRLNRERVMLRTELAGLRTTVTDLKTQVQTARLALQFYVDDHERESAKTDTLLQEKSAEIARLRALLKHPVAAANSVSSNETPVMDWMQPNPLPRGMR